MNDNDSYLQAGFNEFLTRVPENGMGTSPLEFDRFTESMSGNTVQGGVMSTNDGNTELNLEQGFFRVIEGGAEIVRFGRQDDGTVGIVMKDKDGNSLINFTSENNILSSPDGNMELNFNETQFIIRDETGTPRILLGKQIGGF